MSGEHYEILVCSGPTCAGQRHADQVYARLGREVEAHGVRPALRLGRRKCFGFCRRGPNVYVRALGSSIGPEAAAKRPSALYHGVAEDDAHELLESHVLGHRVVERLLEIPDEPEDDWPGHQRADIRLALIPSPSSREPREP